MAVNMDYLRSLSKEELHDLRLDMRRAIFHPGSEFDMFGEQGTADEKSYEETITAIKSILGDD